MRISKWGQILIVSILLAGFQNCTAPYHAVNNTETTSTNSQVADEGLVARGKTLYAQNCASCHGPVDSSTKKGRTVAQIMNALQTVGAMTNAFSSGIPQSSIEAISAALIYEQNGGGVEVGEAGRLEFSCNPDSSISRAPFLKLVNREYENTLNQMLDLFSTSLKNDSSLRNLISTLPSDVLQADRFSRKESSQLVTQLQTLSYFNVAYRAAEVVASNASARGNFPGTNGCLSQSSISRSCHRNFVREFATRAFRRPVGSPEADTLEAQLWDNSLTTQNQIIMTVTSLLQNPEFQYKVFFRGTESRSRLVTLTAHELASRLSYFLTGKAPDDQLRGLANNGTLLQDSVLSAQVDRLLGSNEMRQTIVRLMRESYGYEVFESFNFPQDFRDGINVNGLQQAMVNELDNFFETVVMDRQGRFADILTSRHSNVGHSGLRDIYQVPNQGTQELPEVRSGFLNRGAMLSKRSGRRASPIKRGLMVMEQVLCVDVGEPPPSAPTSLPQVEGVVTTRENTEVVSQAAGSQCVACHERFNPLGFAFEGFDTLGRWRTHERVFDSQGNLLASLPVNTADTSDEVAPTTVSFENALQLSHQLADSDKAILCFTKHIKRFESRGAISEADNCQMNEVAKTLYGNPQQGQGSIQAAIKNLIMSEAFRNWAY